MLTAHGLETIRGIAMQTREDFEEGRLSNEKIIETAVALGAISILATPMRPGLESLGFIELTDIPCDIPRKSYYVERRLNWPGWFPEGHCRSASIVLAKRINDHGLLDRPVELIAGGCGAASYVGAYSLLYGHNAHVFDGIGETELGEDTIVDITGYQYPEVTEQVYIGPLQRPWTRGDPRYDHRVPTY